MIHNVGEVGTFVVTGAPVGGNSLSYMWSWWDNTVDVTSVPVASKKFNVGGVALPIKCNYCDQFGQVNSPGLIANVTINSPPIVVGSPTISANDAMFPFYGTLTATAYDLEDGATAPKFLWYEGATPLGNGITVSSSAGTEQNAYVARYVMANRTLTQLIIDSNNGTTRLDYGIRGYPATGLAGGGASVSNSVIGDTNNLSEVTIGPGQQVTFTVYASDPEPGQLSFVWTLSMVDGWGTNYTETQTPAQLENGSYHSHITRKVEAAHETAGQKTARCAVTNLATGQSIPVPSTVQLNDARTPVISSISSSVVPVNGLNKILRNSYVSFTGTATDRNNLLLDYRWDFSQPITTLWGRTVLLRPNQYAIYDADQLVNGPLNIVGNLTVTDRFGASATVAIDSFVAVQVWGS